MFTALSSDDIHVSAASISARPSVKTGDKITRLAAELGLSAGQLVIAAAEAIIAMVEAREPHIPNIVRVAR
jgi:hypothetical protein